MLFDVGYPLATAIALALAIGASKLSISPWWILVPGAGACAVLITLSAPISTCESDDATGITFLVAGIVAFVSIVLTSLTAFVDVVRGRSARRLLAIVAAVVMGAVTLFGFAGEAIGNCLN